MSPTIEVMQQELEALKKKIGQLEKSLLELRAKHEIPGGDAGDISNEKSLLKDTNDGQGPKSKKLKIQLKRFNLAMLDDTSMILIIGRRQSGRTTLIRDILHHFRDIPMGNVFNRTEQLEPQYQDVVPDPFVFCEVREEHFEQVIKRQDLILDKIMTDPEYEHFDPRSFLVLDNPMLETGWAKQSPMREVFSDGARKNILRILSMSYLIALQKELRELVDWIFVFRETMPVNRSRLYDRICGMFPSQNVFDQVLDEVTADYGCLVIDNRPASRGGRIAECAYWYRADPLQGKTWRTCDDVFWDLDEVMEEQVREEI